PRLFSSPPLLSSPLLSCPLPSPLLSSLYLPPPIQPRPTLPRQNGSTQEREKMKCQSVISNESHRGHFKTPWRGGKSRADTERGGGGVGRGGGTKRKRERGGGVERGRC